MLGEVGEGDNTDVARYEIINGRLAEVLNRFEPDLTAGAIISVSVRDFRVRQLPI